MKQNENKLDMEMTDAEKKEKWLCEIEDRISRRPWLAKVYVLVVVKWLGLTRPTDIFLDCSLLVLIFIFIVLVAVVLAIL